MSFKLIFLSDKFFNDYPESKYPEILHKPDRPYMFLQVTVNNHNFAIPFRTSIRHKFKFKTIGISGLDYTKAVIIDDNDYYIANRRIHLRNDEFKKMIGKEYVIKKSFEKFLIYYKISAKDLSKEYNKKLFSMSALQYFLKDL